MVVLVLLAVPMAVEVCISAALSKQADPVKKLTYNAWQASVKGKYSKDKYGTPAKAKAAKKAAWDKYKSS